ncbi:hypothetical protein N0V87_008799 [Didymella glomerata]|uniref:Uncharacterized protein n=1 Tax=Didymella glomerata TaxID=749621 RepID=A0A9W9BWL4_9PLEO|nr:hypothetical protein N0V87_008799 [Didymella glomerata]
MASRLSSPAAPAAAAAVDIMTVKQLIALLSELDPNATMQEAFCAPTLSPIRTKIAQIEKSTRKQTARCETRTALKVAPIDQTQLKRVLDLSLEWKEDPMAFEREWSLHGSNLQRDGQEVDQNAYTSAQVPAMNDTWYVMLQQHISKMRKVYKEGQEVLMRRILWAVLFYDAVTAQSPRRKEGSGLPTGGMKNLVKKVLEVKAGRKADQKEVEEVTKYVKLGHRCHLVGEAVGQGSWFLYPEQVLDIG